MSDDPRQRLHELSEGVYVEDDVLGIIGRIMEYDPNLRVQYLAGRGQLDDAPYRVVELCPDGIERMVMGCWELDERVLQRLFAADTQKQDILRNLDRVNGDARERSKRRFRDESLAEAKEMTISILRSPKTEYSMPGQEEGEKVIFHSHQPAKIVTRTGREREG